MSNKTKMLLINIADMIVLLVFGTIAYFIVMNFIEKDKDFMDFLKLLGIIFIIISIWVVLVAKEIINMVFLFIVAWFIYDTVTRDESNMWILTMPIILFVWLMSFYLQKRLSGDFFD